jgi:predicted acetyltransferase
MGDFDLTQYLKTGAKIQIVPLAKKEHMRKYFYDYLTELSEFDPHIVFDENGSPVYKWYDAYWEDNGRYPIFLIINNQIAGLSMVRFLGEDVYEMAEFYVLPEFRKDGNAIWFAGEVVKLFDGNFEISTRHTNPRAIKFWDKFVKTFDVYDCNDDETWRNWTLIR